MLEHRLEDFGDQERLAALVLGLLSVTDRLEMLSRVARSDGRESPPGPLADAVLGVISLGRTLRAVLGPCDQPTIPPAEAAGRSDRTPGSFLR
jgi:hypothetical protein